MARLVRCVSGVLVRFMKTGHLPSLPSFLPSNVRLLRSKFDELVYLIQRKMDYSGCSNVLFHGDVARPLDPRLPCYPMITHCTEPTEHTISREIRRG